MSDLQAGEAAAAAVAVAPRVSLADIEAAIASEFMVNAWEAVDAVAGVDHPADGRLAVLTICILVMRNGFTVIGQSAPASPENFDRATGERFAREDAIRQVWKLEGYALRERLAREARAR